MYVICEELKVKDKEKVARMREDKSCDEELVKGSEEWIKGNGYKEKQSEMVKV